jgi:cyclophilin family peptidyl-prolyl cis-trans isomerase
VRRATVLIVILLAALALVACGKDSPLDDQAGPVKEPDSTVATNTTTIPPRSAHDGCEAVAAPTPPATAPVATRSRRRLSPKRRHVATLVTNCGTIRILLDVKRAPKTTASFAGLARSGFYDGLTFHRIAKPGGNDYVIQGGDPLGTGNGGPGYSVVEKPPKGTRYSRGVVAMAKTPDEAPGTSGSQFFIVTAPDTPLPPEYALLGRVLGDTSAVRRIAALTTDPVSEMPLDPVVIASIRIS